MKRIFILSASLLLFTFSLAQKFAIQADKSNILYIEIENPISIAVENYPCKSIIVKSTNGILVGQDGKYLFRPDFPGEAKILLYKKVKGKLKEIGTNTFYVRHLPDPVFKIASGKSEIPKVEIAAQNFVRADYTNLCDELPYDIHASIKSFTVFVIFADTSAYKMIDNEGPAINSEIKSLFNRLKPGDTIFFKNIHASGPNSDDIKLDPVIVTVKE